MYLRLPLCFLCLIEKVICSRTEFYPQKVSNISAKDVCVQKRGRLLCNTEDLSYIMSCFPDRGDVWIDLQTPLLEEYKTAYEGCLNASINSIISNTWKEFPQTQLTGETNPRLCARWCDAVTKFSYNKIRILLSETGRCICMAAAVSISDFRTNDTYCMFAEGQGAKYQSSEDIYKLYADETVKGGRIGLLKKDGNISIDYNGKSPVICIFENQNIAETKVQKRQNSLTPVTFSVLTCTNLTIQFAIQLNRPTKVSIDIAEEVDRKTTMPNIKYATFTVMGRKCFRKQYYDAVVNDTHLTVFSDDEIVNLPFLDQPQKRLQHNRYVKKGTITIETQPLCKKEIMKEIMLAPCRSTTTSETRPIKVIRASANQTHLSDPGSIWTIHKILYVSIGIAFLLLCTMTYLLCLLISSLQRSKSKKGSTSDEATQKPIHIGTVDNGLYIGTGEVQPE